MKRFTRIILLLFMTASQTFAVSCSQADCESQAQGPVSYWAADSVWYKANDTIRQDRIDLIYLVSTNVVSARSENGDTVYRAQLNAADKKKLNSEFAYVEKNIGKGDFNYIAPYYHQLTFESFQQSASKRSELYAQVEKEVCDAFDYYIKYVNNGRRFAIVGFSQGAMLTLSLLKHMTAEQYSKMVAAYSMGYRISEDDMKCSRIIPATDEATPGVTVSYNSVLSKDGKWSQVADDAAAAINPVNWKTDTTSATFTYDGAEHKVHLDTDTKLLIVETANAEKYREWNNNAVFQMMNVNPDCLHHWDLLFYTSFLHDNIQKRSVNVSK